MRKNVPGISIQVMNSSLQINPATYTMNSSSTGSLFASHCNVTKDSIDLGESLAVRMRMTIGMNILDFAKRKTGISSKSKQLNIRNTK